MILQYELYKSNHAKRCYFASRIALRKKRFLILKKPSILRITCGIVTQLNFLFTLKSRGELWQRR
ncbi:MAG TPA: hypothetical protein DEG23_01410 [Coxiellaceae bacterium]|nr:hypothetical protein [Coxiellaceae bacterium]